MYEKIKALAAQRREAITKKEKEAVKAAMMELQNEDPQAYCEALERLIRETANQLDELTMAEKIGEVGKIVSMSHIAHRYFGKSRSWLTHKLNGDTVNGQTAKFTDEEIATLKMALSDISQRIQSISDAL